MPEESKETVPQTPGTAPQTPQAPQPVQAQPGTQAPPWLGTRLEEERQRAAKAKELELAQKYATAIKLEEAYRQSGYDPAQVVADWERQVRETQAQEMRVAPEVLAKLEEQERRAKALQDQQAHLAKLIHEQNLNNLLAQAETLVLQSHPRAKEYHEQVRSALGVYAARYTDTLPALDELVAEGRRVFRDLDYEKAMQEQAAAAAASAQATKTYREQHQALTGAATTSPLPQVDLRALAVSKDPNDRAKMDRYINAVTSGNREEAIRVAAELGLNLG